jgi:hypothetical protein
MADLVYFFVDGAARPGATPGIEALSRALDAWQAAFAGPIKPVLCVSDRGDVLDVLDTRACAFARRATLAGLDAEVYRACEPAVAAGSLRARLAREGTPAGAVDAALARLVERQLVLPVHDKYLALGIPGDVPLLHAPEDSPGGWMHVLNRPLADSVKGALETLGAGGGVPR